jgi:hypothetical protein
MAGCATDRRRTSRAWVIGVEKPYEFRNPCGSRIPFRTVLGGTMKTVLIFALLAILFLAPWLLHQKLKMRAETHNRMQTRVQLRTISEALTALAASHPEIFTSTSLTNLDARRLYLLLTNADLGRTLPPQDTWDSRRQLLDVWGRPFLVAVSSARGSTNLSSLCLLLTLRSKGPNGLDENGSGDDIVGDTLRIALQQ